jgi:membrane-bound lytic murein transglycosylase B
MAEIDALANGSLEPEQTIAELAQLGLQVGDLDPAAPAALFRMELADGSEYWLGLQNFYVITRYNRSRLYSLAVHQLAQQIRAEHDMQLAAVQTVQ